MVRIAFSPRDIWGTPSSQPEFSQHTHYRSYAQACAQDTRRRTLDETTDTDGGGEGGAALVRAVEPRKV